MWQIVLNLWKILLMCGTFFMQQVLTVEERRQWGNDLYKIAGPELSSKINEQLVSNSHKQQRIFVLNRCNVHIKKSADSLQLCLEVCLLI